MITERKRIITEQVIDETVTEGPLTDHRNLLVRYLVEPSTGLLILRLVLGLIFVMHGGQKVFGWFNGPGLSGFAQGMGQMGLPEVLGYAAALAEFGGGVSMILGLLTRLGCLGLIGVMSVAIVKIHMAHGFFGPQGLEYPLTLAMLALTIFLTGPGRFSLDALMDKNSRHYKSRPHQVKPATKVRV